MTQAVLRLLSSFAVGILRQRFPMLGRRRAQSWRYHPAYHRPRHVHEQSEINLVVRGHGVISIGDRMIFGRAGTLVWLPPGLDHYLVSASDDFELFVVGYEPELIATLVREHGEAPNFARPVELLSATELDRWSSVLASTCACPNDGAVEFQLVSLLGRRGDETTNLAHRAASWLLDNPSTDRDTLARRLASNRGDISRAFRREYGMTPSDYKHRVRMLAFFHHLRSGEDSLMHAALAAGFGSYSQCHRVFRKVLGRSPKEYLSAESNDALDDRFEPWTHA